jgi:glycosyltransferase involved in cell wall biosynthesis
MRRQTVKPDRWIVLDNTQGQDGWTPSELTTLHRHLEPLTIAVMRNKCLELALETGCEFIVFWDDDDYYPPERIQTGVEALQAKPMADIAGSSFMYMMLTELNALMSVGPYQGKHATAATWTMRRRYALNNRFDPSRTFGEEASFTHGWNANLIQVDAEKTIVVMGHRGNTVSKTDVFWNPERYLAKVVNNINGKQAFRSRWGLTPELWGLWRTTFSVEESR